MATTVPVIKNSLVKTGPGKVLWAPLGTAIPVFGATAGTGVDFISTAGKFVGDFPTGWLEVGPSDAGFEITQSVSDDPVTVEEQIEPVRYEITDGSMTLALALAHINKANMKLALRGGTFLGAGVAGATVGTGPTLIEKYSAPLLGDEVRVMVAHLSSKDDHITIAYQCFQSGEITRSYRKGADKLVLNLSYRVETPDPTVSDRNYNEWFAGTDQWT